jgi:hypothetical protein
MRHITVYYEPDNSGGIITAWDTRLTMGAYRDVRARKLNGEGEVQWNEEGVPVFTGSDSKYQKVVFIGNDNSGGVIVVGILGKSAVRGDMIYAQRLDAEGNRAWGGGVRINH